MTRYISGMSIANSYVDYSFVNYMAIVKFSNACVVRDPSMDFVPTFRTDFNTWTVNDGCEVEISSNGATLTIKKFNPSTWVVQSNESTSTNTNIASVYSKWRINVSGIQSLVSDGTLSWYSYNPVGATNQTYRVCGVQLCPTMSGTEWFKRFPWDIGISNGAFKDYNGGWSSHGYRYDGIANRFNISSFSDGWGDNSDVQMAIGVYGISDLVDENGILDISSTPITITLLPTNLNTYDSNKGRIYLAKLGTTALINLSKRTVKNSLIEHFGEAVAGTIFNGHVIKDIFGEKWDQNEPCVILPDPSKIVDIDNYNPTNLRIEVANSNGDLYVDWINNYTASPVNFNNVSEGALLGQWNIQNDESNPVIICTASDDNHIAADNLLYSGYNLSNGSTGVANINNVKWIINNGRISTCKHGFQSFTGNLDIVHDGPNGETSPSAYFGFAPLQLDATFAGNGISIIKREWLYWNNVFNLSYMCDNNTIIEEIQAHDNAIAQLRKYANGYNVNATTFNQYTWPYGGSSNMQWPQIFSWCSNLHTVEPIIDMKYVHNITSLYRAFGNCYRLKKLKLKSLNCFNWDFTNSTYFNLPSLDNESVTYMLNNVEDIISVPFDSTHTFTENVGSNAGLDSDTEIYDYKNIRTQSSLNGLYINCPAQWIMEITPAALATANSRGWIVKVAGTEVSSTDVKGDWENLDDDFIENSHIKTNYAIGDTCAYTTTSVNGWSYKIIDCSAEDEFIISTYGGNTPRAYCFVDSNNIVLSVANATINMLGVVVAPEGSAKLIVNYGNPTVEASSTTYKRAIRKKI